MNKEQPSVSDSLTVRFVFELLMQTNCEWDICGVIFVPGILIQTYGVSRILVVFGM
jgi:hypothetical protein